MHFHISLQTRNSQFVLEQITSCEFPCANTQEGTKCYLKYIHKYIRANVKYANVYKTYRVISVNRQTDILFAVVYVSNKFWNQSLRKLLKYSSQQILVPTRGSSHFPARA